MTSGNSFTRRELFTYLGKALSDADIETPQLEAGFIIEHVTGMELPRFLMDGGTAAETETVSECLRILERRRTGEPLQYIFGQWDFFGMTFKVGSGVLIPRADTETIAEAAIKLRENANVTRFADLCSGSGCIAAAVSRYVESPEGYAVEYSVDAFPYLEENLRNNAVNTTAVFADVLKTETAGKFTDLDLITANPPYLTKRDMGELQREVTYEPEMALFGGDDGLYFYRELARVWKSSLKCGGWLLFEMGLGQYRDVMDILEENGYEDVSFSCDLAGIERVVMGRKPLGGA